MKISVMNYGITYRYQKYFNVSFNLYNHNNFCMVEIVQTVAGANFVFASH
jgi:hypothetical protein